MYLNGYRYELLRDREGETSDESPPWPTTVLTRRDLAVVCDVVEREARGDRFDRVGVEDGRLSVVYDDPGASIRESETRERVRAVPAYQAALVDFPVSHVRKRHRDDGDYLVYGYGPDGPSAGERALD